MIRTRPATDAYRDNFEQAMGAPAPAPVRRSADASWSPPFISDEAPEGLQCPVCGEKDSVWVRAQEFYTEGGVDAFCGDCHALLYVHASIEITFSHPVVA